MNYRTATREERAAEFIDFATKLHDSRYDYEHVERSYVNGDTKVTIICPDHGPFEQTPREHRRVRETPWGPQRGQGCRDCKGFRNANQELRTQRFIQCATNRHGDKYDYAKVVFIDQKTYVTVICPLHGGFQERPDNHVAEGSVGCKDCHRLARRAGRSKTKRK